MEIIRSGIIRNWIICYFNLVLVLWFVATMGIRTIDADGGRVSMRKQKLEELLRVLKSYPPSNHQDVEPSAVVIKNQSSKLAPNSLEYDVLAPHPTPMSIKESAAKEAVVQLKSQPVSSYEDFYRIFYGTEEGVNHLKRHYGPEGLKRARAQYRTVTKEMEDLKSANEHFLRIRTKARCKTPVPRLIRVKDYYPNPSKIYLPRCTLLHRCGETAGCCDSDAYQCVPSTVQNVALHFYKLTVGKNGLGHGKTNKDNIERLVFVNHTSCHCQPINDLPRAKMMDHDGLPTPPSYPLDGTSSTTTKTRGDDDEFHDDNKTHDRRAVSLHHHRHHQTQSNSKCRECPVPFNSRTYRDGRCGCDCFDRQKPCLKIKRGKNPLNEVERRCVESNFCHHPDCEYGKFDVSTGYCPRRHDETPRESIRNRSPNDPLLSSPRRRWTFN